MHKYPRGMEWGLRFGQKGTADYKLGQRVIDLGNKANTSRSDIIKTALYFMLPTLEKNLPKHDKFTVNIDGEDITITP